MYVLEIFLEKQKADRYYKGPVNCIVRVARENGMSRCFRGLTPCLIRDITSFPIYILTWEHACRLYDARGPEKCPIGVTFVAGGLAGCMSWSVNLPVDFVKSRMQADDLNKPRLPSTLECARDMLARDGARSFYRGLPAVLSRAFVFNAVTLPVYALVKPLLKESD